MWRKNMTDLIESSLLKEPSVSKTTSSSSSSEAINVIHFQKDSSPQNPSNDADASTKKDALKTTVVDLASLSPLDYDLKRKEVAKEMGVQVKTLDAEVKTARGDVFAPSSMIFPDVTPFPEPVNPADLFNEIAKTIQLFIVLDVYQALAITLWIAMTWVIVALKVAPLALVDAPEKACGKSQFLDMISFLSYKALSSSNITTAGLFRLTEQYSPTLLIDEVDTFLHDNNDLKGLINAGHTRNSAFVIRIVGENNEPKRFNVFGAKALAGISLTKHLPDSTMSRGIIFNMRRKLPHEVTKRLRHAEMSVFDEFKSKLARFALDYEAQIKASRPVMPDELSDRAQDNWEPLLAIAGCAGSDYLQRATEAALKLSVTNDSSVSIGTELLQSIQLIFENEAILKISSAALVDELMSYKDQPWATYNKGWPMSPRQIAQLLKQYGIKPKTIRIREGCTPKGYSSDQFDDAFARYLSVDKLIIESNGEISQEQPAVELSGLERMILDDRKYRDVVTESSVTELADENSNGDFPYEEAF
jgi:hypothetical protein